MIIFDESKPYIFISYAHKDSEKVYYILQRLANAHFNIWYDRGIEANTDWDENIANHISECSYFISFMSGNYMGSSNCKDELNYARDLEKEILLVYLEDVTLPPGMAMRMNRSQAVIWNEMDDLYTDEDFQKLINANGIRKTVLTNKSGPRMIEVDNDYVLNKCPNCGANLPSMVGKTSVSCEYCNSTISVRNPNTQTPPPTRDTTPPPSVTYAKQTAQRSRKVAIIVAAVTIGVVITMSIFFAALSACVGGLGVLARQNNSRKNTTSNSGIASAETVTEAVAETNPEEELLSTAQDAVEGSFEYYFESDADRENTYVYFLAEIRNPNEAVITENVSAKIVARASDGTIVDTRTINIDRILPQDTANILDRLSGEFGMLDENSEITMELVTKDFRVYSDSDYSRKAMMSNIEVFNVSTFEEKYGGTQITGEVTNNSGEDIDFMEFAVGFYKDEKLVCLDEVFISDIGNGKTGAFSETLYADFPEYDTIVIKPVR